MTDLFNFIILVLIASTLQSSTGFGFSIMATPFLLLLFQPHDAIQLNIAISFFISGILFYKVYKDVDKEIFKRLIKGSLVGIFPGIILFAFLDERPLKLLVGILFLMATTLLIAKVKIKQTKKNEWITGGLAGLLTTSMGMPGPPLLIYFAGAKIDKIVIRSTTLAYFLCIYPISLLLQFILFDISIEVWKSTLWSLPFAIIGIIIGQWIFVRLNQQIFLVIIYMLIFLTGLYLLITNL